MKLSGVVYAAAALLLSNLVSAQVSEFLYACVCVLLPVLCTLLSRYTPIGKIGQEGRNTVKEDRGMHGEGCMERKRSGCVVVGPLGQGTSGFIYPLW
jgi:hypothetical protein